MGERSQTPVLIARKRKSGRDRLYWSADKVSRKAKGYPERLIPLPRDATEAEIIDLCETYAARLRLWSDQGPAPRWLYERHGPLALRRLRAPPAIADPRGAPQHSRELHPQFQRDPLDRR